MARNLMPRKSGAIISFAALLFFLAPDVLRSYPQTVVVGDAFSWAGDKFMQGLASGAFFFAICFACWLVSDAFRWLTGSRAETTSTPAELEAGTASPLHELEVLEAEVAGAEPPVAPTSTPDAEEPTTTRGKVGALLMCSIFFAYEFYTRGVLSPEKPLMENIAATLLYILRGWEVIFVGFIALLFGAWASHSRSASTTATTTPPAEVLFEGTLPEEEPLARDNYAESEKV